MLEFLKKYKFIIAGAACVIVVLCIAFFSGKPLEAPKETQSETVVATQNVTEQTTSTAALQEKTTVQPSNSKSDETKPSKNETATQKPTEKATSKPNVKPVIKPTEKPTEKPEKDKYNTNINEIPQNKPKPVEPQEQETKDTRLKCTLSISCATILNNMDELDPAKKDLVPSDGWILKPKTVVFNEGESVFDILQRVCKEQKIHMEATFTPMYNSSYIEGINNIYEFDCGSLSGWRYAVNGWYPNYGSSRYPVQNGDIIEFNYTCSLGYDLQDGGVGGQQ